MQKKIELSKGFGNKEISNALGVSPSAVTGYIRKAKGLTRRP
jgi:predicted transcriptional regulator